MLVKKLSSDATIPTRANPGDAGVDLVATSCKHDVHYIEYGTSLAVAIPDGFVGLLFPRSSVSNTNMVLANSVGVIDSSYRGEVKVRFKLTGPGYMAKTYAVGDRVAQLVIVPIVEAKVLEVQELPESKRGAGGFGSSGT